MEAGDKKGDKNSSGKNSTLETFLRIRSQRAIPKIYEALWAVDEAVPNDFDPPPEWVKLLIQRSASIKPLLALKNRGEADSPEQRGSLTGLARALMGGLSSAQENEPENQPMSELLEAIQKPLQIQLADKGGLPIESPLTDVEAYSAGHQKGVQIGGRISRDEVSITEGLADTLWDGWPLLEGAGNRKQAYEWLQQLGFICSFDLFEKLCKQIEFSPSSRMKNRSTDFPGS